MKAAKEASNPKDPIETLDSETLAYLAGIIDGEGSIYVAAVGPQRTRSVYPIVCVAMTDLDLINWIAGILKAGTVKNHGTAKRSKENPHWKKQYRTQLFGKRAQLICGRLLPFLRVKRRQAELVLTFPCDARIAPGVKIERTSINEIRYALRDEINALNHKPRNPAALRG